MCGFFDLIENRKNYMKYTRSGSGYHPEILNISLNFLNDNLSYKNKSFKESKMNKKIYLCLVLFFIYLNLIMFNSFNFMQLYA